MQSVSQADLIGCIESTHSWQAELALDCHLQNLSQTKQVIASFALCTALQHLPLSLDGHALCHGQ